ncbi:hypothetical protein K502DRAFT_353071 [Neoconidiobolus thromboides FSU 785]|nr:hypothetical protein K502DRAFT_353071 [Neoconidiobolus thromboides FSU 785]
MNLIQRQTGANLELIIENYFITIFDINCFDDLTKFKTVKFINLEDSFLDKDFNNLILIKNCNVTILCYFNRTKSINSDFTKIPTLKEVYKEINNNVIEGHL